MSDNGALKPFKYQEEVLNEIEWFEGRPLIALDPGLGKTLVSAVHLARNPKCLPAIAVCPKSVKYVWEREFKRTLPGRRIWILESTTPYSKFNPNNQPDLAIINYDILQYWTRWIKWWKPKTVIVDECQYICNQSKRTAAVRRVCKPAPYVLALSGTPFLNRPIELYNILSILRPDIWNSRYEYAQEFCGAEWTPWGWDYSKASNTEKLHQLLHDHVMVRRIKKDVLPDLPEKTRIVIPLPMKDQAQYDKAQNDFREWVKSLDPIRAIKALKAEALTRVGYLLRLSAQLKLPNAIEWINDWLDDSDPSEKMVVFTNQIQVIQDLRKGCKGESLMIDGSVTGDKRTQAVERFQKDPTVRLMFGNLRAAGTGVDGLQVASNVAFVELGWNPGTVIQGEDRCCRIGSKNAVTVYYLLAQGTEEERVCRILQERQEVFNQIIDGTSPEAESKVDVFDMYWQELQQELLG